MYKKSNITAFLIVSVFMFNIMTSGTVLSVMNLPLSYAFGLFFIFVSLVMIFFFDITLPLSKFKLYTLVVSFLIFFLMLLPGVFFNESLTGYEGLVVRFLLISMLFVFLIQPCINIKRYLETSLWIVMGHALIGWCVSMLPFVSYAYITNGSYETSTFFYFFFRWVAFDFYGLTVYRNMGLFWEPGLLQIFSNLLLFLLLLKKSHWKFLILPIFITMTTLSTTGFIIMTLLIVRFSSFFKFDKLLLFKVIFTLAIFIGTISVTEDKFRGEGVGSSSARLFDLYNGLQIVKDNFWFGIGYEDDVYLELLEEGKGASVAFDSVENVRGNTNSFLKVFFVFGVPLGIIYIFIIAQNRYFYPARGFYFLFIILVTSTEPVMFMNFFLFLFIMSASTMFSAVRKE